MRLSKVRLLLSSIVEKGKRNRKRGNRRRERGSSRVNGKRCGFETVKEAIKRRSERPIKERVLSHTEDYKRE